MHWNLSDAKNRLSEVLDRAGRDGPQTIRRRSESFVVLSADEYERLAGKKPTFTEFLLSGPRIDDLEAMPRSDSRMRDVDL